MLIDILTKKKITQMPHDEQFSILKSRLTDKEFDDIERSINDLIDKAGAQIATAGWLPGNNWMGTPFQAIFDKAAKRDFNTSARFFGLLVWHAVMQRSETWASGRYEKNGQDIGSRTYFRVVVKP